MKVILKDTTNPHFQKDIGKIYGLSNATVGTIAILWSLRENDEVDEGQTINTSPIVDVQIKHNDIILRTKSKSVYTLRVLNQ